MKGLLFLGGDFMKINLALNSYEFEEYLIDCYDELTEGIVGIHYIFRFPNGFGASVIKTKCSIGFENNKWELCVLIFEEKNKLALDEYYTVYLGEITGESSSVGNLTDKQVINYLRKIKEVR